MSSPRQSPETASTIVALPDVETDHSEENGPVLQAVAEAGPSTHKRAKKGESDDGGPSEYIMDVDDAAGGDVSPVTMAIPLPTEIEEMEEWWDLKMTWSGKVYELRVGGNDMVYDFRQRLMELTNVPPDRQKLIGLTKGKLSVELDSARFGTLGIKQQCKFTMIGTPEELSFKDPSDAKLPDMVDNFDVEYKNAAGRPGVKLIAPAEDPRNKRMIDVLIKKYPITVMNEPRPGKRLLVLDLDYTIVDTKPLIAGSLPADETARPGLHEFLERAYVNYDIVVWSQTHWRWLESKLVELGIIGGESNYKIAFVSDRTSMFPVFTERNGQAYKHEVKPLAYFWASFPQWSAKNSIHIDDLSRNFAMNPGEGLRIRAFKGAGGYDGLMDRELSKLSVYLDHLANNVEDFQTVDHSRWKKDSPVKDMRPSSFFPPLDSADPRLRGANPGRTAPASALGPVQPSQPTVAQSTTADQSLAAAEQTAAPGPQSDDISHKQETESVSAEPASADSYQAQASSTSSVALSDPTAPNQKPPSPPPASKGPEQ